MQAQYAPGARVVISDSEWIIHRAGPIKVGLAEVALWLKSLTGGHSMPCFCYQLFSGNSLIGARMEGEIYHCLLPDPGIVVYSDKGAGQLRPVTFRSIKKWNKAFCAPLGNNEPRPLKTLRDAVDRLWREHIGMLAQDRCQLTQDTHALWGQGEVEERHTRIQAKDYIRARGIFNNSARSAAPYRRLKLLLDCWYALWQWPLKQVDALPDRQKKLFDLNTVQESVVHKTYQAPNGPWESTVESQTSFFRADREEDYWVARGDFLNNFTRKR
ncbi:hypothetical protein [Billgrantia ethanolica]|uniref:Uncharacterized protein n=1 Tax=Billgrantia ethanolica TaxID=2733486 RepID=A0ABS9A6C6_9GAMM|nr:hypothetical protein [Halomonas ethanolica]MCE8004406.1 hypothetical protein [Halomonas ethanolica]